MEEKWIPGWTCEVVKSESGYNEKGAIFRTDKAFGTELIWYTKQHSICEGLIEFINFANGLYVFEFTINLSKERNSHSTLKFTHSFTSLNENGVKIINEYKKEDFQMRLHGLGKLIENYIQNT